MYVFVKRGKACCDVISRCAEARVKSSKTAEQLEDSSGPVQGRTR